MGSATFQTASDKEKRNKKRWILVRQVIFRVFLILLLSAPFISLLVWFLKPKLPLNVLILDKTVHDKRGTEHRSFNWVLNHEKYTKKDGDFYQIESDYLGFFPLDDKKFLIQDLDEYKQKQLDSIADTLDMIYVTDTYGMYEKEWYGRNPRGDHSPIIYGGLTVADFTLIKKMYEQQKLVLMEFNTISSPTNTKLRNMVEELFGIRWTGWVGRHFYSFDTLLNPELPKWLIESYERQYDTTWAFTGKGIAFVHENGEVVILEKEKELRFEIPVIYTDEFYADFYDVEEYIRYPFWFDISHVSFEELTISNFILHPTEYGDSVLNHFGIPDTFPAVSGDIIANRFFYFGGDFADNPIPHYGVYFEWMETFDYFYYNNRDLSDRRKFFWRYYRPFMTQIMKDNYALMKNQDLDMR